MSCPTNQNYFFSAKLDDDETILECVKINIIYKGTRRKKKGYLAITNKRYLIADSDGVYSFKYLLVTREAVYELGIFSIVEIILIFELLLTISANIIIATILLLVAIIIGPLIILPLAWNKLRVSGTAKFYKSDFTWEIEGGERTEARDFSAVIWSDEVGLKELVRLLKQNPG